MEAPCECPQARSIPAASSYRSYPPSHHRSTCPSFRTKFMLGIATLQRKRTCSVTSLFSRCGSQHSYTEHFDSKGRRRAGACSSEQLFGPSAVFLICLHAIEICASVAGSLRSQKNASASLPFPGRMPTTRFNIMRCTYPVWLLQHLCREGI